jgi:hypothetical protein
MVSHHGACDANRLRAFLDAPPAEDGAACELAEHLEQCEKCRKELEALAGGRWWNEVRPVVAPGPAEPGSRTQPHEGHMADDPVLGFLAPPDTPGHVGRFGAYQVLGVHRGGMGVVLKAWDPALMRTVAIKVLAPQLATSGAARQRFAREARAAAAVVHHHVVAIHNVDTDKASGLPYLVMPYVAGRSLQERLDRDGPLEPAAALRVGLQAAQGLAAAHAQGIVHRDVKPANILLENGVERVVLTDFGLARAADDASVTQSGVIAGTPQYMSPEQARGEAVGPRSDLFSLGSVLYAMCTGRPPFRAPNTMAVLRRVSDEPARPVREVNPAVPAPLAALIAKLHAKDPAKRYPSAAAVAAELERQLADLQTPPGRPTLPALAAGRPAAPRRRRWAAVAAAGLLLAALGFGLAAATPRHQDADDLLAASNCLPPPAGEWGGPPAGAGIVGQWPPSADKIRLAEDEPKPASVWISPDVIKKAEIEAAEAKYKADERRAEIEVAEAGLQLARDLASFGIDIDKAEIEEAEAKLKAEKRKVDKLRAEVEAAEAKLKAAIGEAEAKLKADKLMAVIATAAAGPVLRLDNNGLAILPPPPPAPAAPGAPPVPPAALEVGLKFGNGEPFVVMLGKAGEKVVGSGKPVTKDYDLKDFTTVQVHGPFAVELKQGGVFKVSVTADDNLFDHLQVYKEGKTLNIGLKGKNLSFHLSGKDPLKAAVTLPALEGLRLDGAARATAEGFASDRPLRLALRGACKLEGKVSAGDVEIDAKGASSVRLGGSGKNLRLRAEGASSLRMPEFAAGGDKLIVDAAGASNVSLKGAVKLGVLHADGASTLSLDATALNAADVKLNAASNAKVQVKELLDYSLSGASHLRYQGNPKIGKESKKTGASSVSQTK